MKILSKIRAFSSKDDVGYEEPAAYPPPAGWQFSANPPGSFPNTSSPYNTSSARFPTSTKRRAPSQANMPVAVPVGPVTAHVIGDQVYFADWRTRSCSWVDPRVMQSQQSFDADPMRAVAEGGSSQRMLADGQLPIAAEGPGWNAGSRGSYMSSDDGRPRRPAAWENTGLPPQSGTQPQRFMSGAPRQASGADYGQSQQRGSPRFASAGPNGPGRSDPPQYGTRPQPQQRYYPQPSPQPQPQQMQRYQQQQRPPSFSQRQSQQSGPAPLENELGPGGFRPPSASGPMPGRIGMPDPGTYLTKAAALQNQYQRDQAAKHAQLQQQLRQLEAEEAEMNRRRAEQTRALEIERKVLEEEEQDLLLADASALGIELRAMKGLSARLALLESQLERSDQAGMAAPAPQAAGQ